MFVLTSTVKSCPIASVKSPLRTEDVKLKYEPSCKTLTVSATSGFLYWDITILAERGSLSELGLASNHSSFSSIARADGFIRGSIHLSPLSNIVVDGLTLDAKRRLKTSPEFETFISRALMAIAPLGN